MTINMTAVQSSSIAQLGYKRRTMQVTFNNGKSYEFKKVPRAQFDKFFSANSKGKFFLNEIKTNYPYTELLN